MFTRFSFSLSRILRLKSRRESKALAVPGLASSPPSPSPPPPPPKNGRGPALRVQLATPPLHQHLPTPVSYSPQLSPIAGAPGPVIVIGQDPRSYVVTEKVPSLTGDTAHLVVLEPPRQRCVSFADQRARARADSTTSSSSPTSSRWPTPVPTLCVDQVPPKPLPSPLLLQPDTPAAAEVHQWEDIDENAESTAAAKSSNTKGSKRPLSLFSPRPTGTKGQRFSVPPLPATKPESFQRRASKRESKRVSVMPVGGASATAKREKRKSRWSQEMERADTQEVLRALRDMH
ncbi:hypothetical protein PAXINDRAFT_169498 [Paxillus involutus ATCC 200175]|uniref:Uncharacterized protein n=1 Tax=Paxillus involutus ATCC 200175 TaxID=664439 RepID=A0A0C9U5W0_PAXIN|nr:hypothetical protein PAXINDRAFT_169498 [Paxillus involutus ATCC 200175]